MTNLIEFLTTWVVEAQLNLTLVIMHQMCAKSYSTYKHTTNKLTGKLLPHKRNYRQKLINNGTVIMQAVTIFAKSSAHSYKLADIVNTGKTKYPST